MPNPVGARLSENNGDLPWVQMAKYLNFVYLMQTYGTDGIDGQLYNYRMRANEVGIPYGEIHFAKVTKHPQRSAERFFSHLSAEASLRPELMLTKSEGLGKTELLNWFIKFTNRFYELSGGIYPIIKTTPGFWGDNMPRNDRAKQCGLDIIHWRAVTPRVPADWSGINQPKEQTFWEFEGGQTFEQDILGLSSGWLIPLSRYNGSFEWFNSEYKVNESQKRDPTVPPTPKPKPDPVPQDEIVIIGKRKVIAPRGVNTRLADNSGAADAGTLAFGSIVPITEIRGEWGKSEFWFYLPGLSEATDKA